MFSISKGRIGEYTLRHLQQDLISGLIVGVIAIPLAMAFAIASGVKPEYGIYTTIVAGIIISLFGGTRFQIGGPTGAFVPILLAIVMQYGYENLLLAGFLAGVMLFLMGILRLGVLIKFIPRPVTIGFTAGIAVIIFSGQIVSFLGLRNVQKHDAFLDNMKEIGIHINTINIYSVLTAVICLLVLLFLPRILPKIPAPIVGLIISSVVATFFFPDKVATIGSTFGDIPSSLPHFHLPAFTVGKIQTLLRPALVIALLGGIESLLSAVVADGMKGTTHNSNRELIGQGLANMAAPLFGGIPATGAIARTATNIKSGAISPLSGVFHSLSVLGVLLLFAPYASHIPLASMAPILMLVAWNMSERRQFAKLLKTRTADSAILVITFLLTVLSDLTTAVEVGMIFAVIMFVKRMGDVMTVAKVLPDPEGKHQKVSPYIVNAGHDCPQISILNIEGPLFFGASQELEKSVSDAVQLEVRVLILRMGKVPYMDTTGESAMAKIVGKLHEQGGTILFSGLQQQPRDVMERTGLYQRIGKECFFEHTGEAINQALKKIDRNLCIGCTHFAFHECVRLSQQNEAIPRRWDNELKKTGNLTANKV
jgi:sulfate permease, SulP family